LRVTRERTNTVGVGGQRRDLEFGDERRRRAFHSRYSGVGPCDGSQLYRRRGPTIRVGRGGLGMRFPGDSTIRKAESNGGAENRITSGVSYPDSQ
jgi:hypothetical protein